MFGYKELKAIASVVENMAKVYAIMFIVCGIVILADIELLQINSEALQTLKNTIKLWRHLYLQADGISPRIIVIFNASVSMYGKCVKEIALLCMLPALLNGIQGKYYCFCSYNNVNILLTYQ
jgi:hypothetical protein